MSTAIQLNELWEKIRHNQTSAYTQLYKLLCIDLHTYLFYLGRDHDLASDILQDLFTKMWVKRADIGPIVNVKAYFYSACRLMYINHFRKQQRHHYLLLSYPGNELETSIEDKISKFEEGQHLKSKLFFAIEKLPCRQKEIVRMKYFDELAYEKIAEVTGLKYQSVVNHIYRAVQSLRAEF